MPAFVDGDYKLLWVDVGTPGTNGNSAVFNTSGLKEAMETGATNFPEPEHLAGDNDDILCLDCDDIFAL